jgi:hypothetical protein
MATFALQHELHLQQTLHLLCPKLYKHPKTTKLNLNTPLMKQNYNFFFIISYLSWIILDSCKTKTFVNSYVRFALMDFQSQFLTSHAIFNRPAYAQWVDQIIFCRFSSFSIYDVTSRGMLPTPHALRPNTCNSYCEANLTKVGFSNGGHYFATITNLSHSRWALVRMRLVIFDHSAFAQPWHFSRCKHSF